jgi:hypothetical protein
MLCLQTYAETSNEHIGKICIINKVFCFWFQTFRTFYTPEVTNEGKESTVPVLAEMYTDSRTVRLDLHCEAI